MKKWLASAPANIALIKYMGKSDASQNKGSNPSLSYSLCGLTTEVELELSQNNFDSWQALGDAPILAAKGQERFLRHFQFLKNEFGIKQNFIVRSRNNFPSDAGIASSASSFAALTRTALTAFSDLTTKPVPSLAQMADYSRRGSGSSCRSFFPEWCAWDGESQVESVPSALGPLTDFVVAVESGAKQVSSSDAHLKVASSPLYIGRSNRARARMDSSLKALEKGDWQTLCQIAWAELWDMHSLFHTSEPPFFYFKPGTISVLEWSQNFWTKNGVGPMTTIDAGPNVHLLVKSEERALYEPQIRALAESLSAKVFVS